MLLHQAYSDYHAAWRDMERAYKDGLVRAIGVSNFDPTRLLDICTFAEVAPMVNQVETHVFWQQHYAHENMENLGVAHMAWGPFAEGANNFFQNPLLSEIGEKYGKSVGQVALRYLLDLGVIVIPKSTHKERMEENRTSTCSTSSFPTRIRRKSPSSIATARFAMTIATCSLSAAC